MIGFAKIIIILNMKSPILISFCLANLFIYFQAAKETGALQAAKSKLEKEVEELTWRLQLEKRIRVSFIIQFTITLVFYLRQIATGRGINLKTTISTALSLVVQASFLLPDLKKNTPLQKYISVNICVVISTPKKSTVYGNDENRISNLHFSF